MLHRPLSANIPAAAPPTGKIHIGINYRSTFAFPNNPDGDIDVWSGAPGSQLFADSPTYTNLNGDSLVAGWNIVPPMYDWNAPWDVRLAGSSYMNSVVRAVYAKLTPGTWRIWAGWGIHVSQGVTFTLYDGYPLGTGTALQSGSESLSPDRCFNILEQAKVNQSVWAAEYDNDYFEFIVPDRGASNTGITLEVGSGTQQTYFNHFRVQDVTP